MTALYSKDRFLSQFSGKEAFHFVLNFPGSRTAAQGQDSEPHQWSDLFHTSSLQSLRDSHLIFSSFGANKAATAAGFLISTDLNLFFSSLQNGWVLSLTCKFASSSEIMSALSASTSSEMGSSLQEAFVGEQIAGSQAPKTLNQSACGTGESSQSIIASIQKYSCPHVALAVSTEQKYKLPRKAAACRW